MEQIFPNWEFGGRDGLRYCSLEYSQVSTVDLLKSHFGTVLEESFTLLPSAPGRINPYCLDGFPFTGLRNVRPEAQKLSGACWPE